MGLIGGFHSGSRIMVISSQLSKQAQQNNQASDAASGAPAALLPESELDTWNGDIFGSAG